MIKTMVNKVLEKNKNYFLKDPMRYATFVYLYSVLLPATVGAGATIAIGISAIALKKMGILQKIKEKIRILSNEKTSLKNNELKNKDFFPDELLDKKIFEKIEANFSNIKGVEEVPEEKFSTFINDIAEPEKVAKKIHNIFKNKNNLWNKYFEKNIEKIIQDFEKGLFVKVSNIENAEILKKYLKEIENNFDNLVGELEKREERIKMYEIRYFFKKLQDKIDNRIEKLKSMQPNKLNKTSKLSVTTDISNSISNRVALEM